MAELSKGFPPDVTWSIPYDTTPFISLSIEEVVKTLGEAMLLVFLVMFLFLQNWRATVIPSVVVPIALAGACLGLWRSEEHTSELQSLMRLSYVVFSLKKKTHDYHTSTTPPSILRHLLLISYNITLVK